MKEMLISTCIGEFVTLVIFALLHQMFIEPLEVIAFWAATHMVATYAVWTLIVWREECRHE